MRVIQKIFIIFIISICIFSIMPINKSEATLSELVERMDATETEASTTASLRKIVARLLGVLQVVSGFATIIIIAFTGFEYLIMETPNMRQEIKKRMLPIIIGLICVFSAVSIAQFVLGSFE